MAAEQKVHDREKAAQDRADSIKWHAVHHRQSALERAVQTEGQHGHEAVLKAARKFYAFINGDEPSET